MSETSLAPPPRLSGTVEQRLTTLLQWLWDFYTRIALTDIFVRFAEQFGPTSFDPASLPDPSTSTIAQAQETANNAFILAVNALNQIGLNGQFTVSEAATTIVVTLADEETNADYNVVATPQALTGAPAAGAFTIKKIDKTVTGFTVTFEAAPGAGTSVTFDFQLRRG